MDKNHKKLLQCLKMWVMLILTGGLLHSSVYWGCKREHWKELGRPNFQKENGRVSAFQQKQSTALVVWGGLEMFCFVLTLRKKWEPSEFPPKRRNLSPADRQHLFSGPCPDWSGMGGALQPPFCSQGPTVEPPPLPGPSSVLRRLSAAVEEWGQSSYASTSPSPLPSVPINTTTN